MSGLGGVSFAAFLASALVLSAAAPEQAAAPKADPAAGVIKGTVKLKGVIPARRKLRVENEPN